MKTKLYKIKDTDGATIGETSNLSFAMSTISRANLLHDENYRLESDDLSKIQKEYVDSSRELLQAIFCEKAGKDCYFFSKEMRLERLKSFIEDFGSLVQSEDCELLSEETRLNAWELADMKNHAEKQQRK